MAPHSSMHKKRKKFVIVEQDMPRDLVESVLTVVQSVLKKDKKNTMVSASELISKRLKEIEPKDWQVVVLCGSFTSTCIHKPGRFLSFRYDPYSLLIWQCE